MPPFAYLPQHLLVAWPRLSSGAKAVAVALACHMNGSGECWPSVEALRKLAGFAQRRSVENALRELRERKVISVTPRGHHRTNLYRWSDPNRNAGSGSPDPNAGAPGPERERGTEQYHEHNTTPAPAREGPKRADVGEEKKARPGRPSPNAPEGRRPNVWTLWVEARRERGLREPIRDGPDLGAAKRLGGMVARGELTEDELRSVMRAYLADRDPFIARNGHGLRHLHGGRIARYLHEVSREMRRREEIEREIRTRRAEREGDYDPMVFRDALALGLGIAAG